MNSWVNDGSAVWLFVVGAGVLGGILSPVTEVAITRFLPRVGVRPSIPVQITTAAITFAACAAFSIRFGMSFSLPAFLLLAVVGTQLGRIDIARHLLPNPLVLTLLVGGFVLLLLPALVDDRVGDLARALAGGMILFSAYLLLALISPGGIGMGDVKLAAPIGLYLGYLGWPQLLYGGLLGFIINGLVSALAASRNRRISGAEVAHGPSMLLAAAVAALVVV
ncbi:prepilin peptidase [Pseudarthrobacter sp. L1SW]|uniref:prepilin peptidase n=1 Tax=Pseudarthrobacter sp. L1SW TaxID=2851598 RepID=UPI001E403B50|nr:prepilin peptidase [Pseudarthrobacter sp. L1SW]UEL27545.1 prepilin peptidase [Pseudarthrobacter sp. L1SW]